MIRMKSMLSLVLLIQHLGIVSIVTGSSNTLDWSRCGREGDTKCYVRQSCTNPNRKKDLLVELLDYDVGFDCDVGVQIKPYSSRKYVFTLQANMSNMDVSEGLLMTQNADIAGCKLDGNITKAIHRPDLVTAVFIGTPIITEDFISCKLGVSIAGTMELQNTGVFYYQGLNGFPTLKLFSNGSSEVITHDEKEHNMWQRVTSKVTCNPDLIQAPLKETHSSDFTFHQIPDNTVQNITCTEIANTSLYLEKDDLTAAEIWNFRCEENKYKYCEDPSCGTSNVLEDEKTVKAFCGSPICCADLRLLTCDSCTDFATTNDSCADNKPTCPDDNWMINDNIPVHGQPECKKHNGVYSWTMPGDKIMTNGACSNLIDCSTSIPLQSKCDAGDACIAPTVSNNITCPKAGQVLRHRLPANQSKYTEVKYINCDQKNGKWMADNKVVVDKTSVINCITTAVVISATEEAKSAGGFFDEHGFYIILAGCLLFLIVLTAVMVYCCIRAKRKYGKKKVVLTKEEMELRKRPPGGPTDLIADIDDTSTFDDWLLEVFSQKYQYYSIYERLVVVKRIILDAKVVELFRFLQAAFVHEVDHRVWIAMLEGVKNMHYLIAFWENISIKIMDKIIKTGADNLIKKYGWDEKPNEPFEHTFLRYIGAHLLFYIGDADALKKLEQLYNDHYVPGKDGKTLKPELKTCLRIVVWGNAAKNLSKNDEVRELIPQKRIENEEVVDIFGTRTQHVIKAYVYYGDMEEVSALTHQMLHRPRYTSRDVVAAYTTMMELDYTRYDGIRMFFDFDGMFLAKVDPKDPTDPTGRKKEQDADYKQVFDLLTRNTITCQELMFIQENLVNNDRHTPEFLANVPLAQMNVRSTNHNNMRLKLMERAGLLQQVINLLPKEEAVQFRKENAAGLVPALKISDADAAAQAFAEIAQERLAARAAAIAAASVAPASSNSAPAPSAPASVAAPVQAPSDPAPAAPAPAPATFDPAPAPGASAPAPAGSAPAPAPAASAPAPAGSAPAPAAPAPAASAPAPAGSAPAPAPAGSAPAAPSTTPSNGKP